MKKVSIFLMLLLAGNNVVFAQYLSQIGYKIKLALPLFENYVVLGAENQNDRLIKEAKNAQLILKKNFTVFAVSYLGDMKKNTDIIKKMEKCLVIIVSDEEVMNQTTVRWISQQLTPAGIPIISTRTQDTMLGALFTIFNQEGELQTHLNKIVLHLLNLTLPVEIEQGCVVDVE